MPDLTGVEEGIPKGNIPEKLSWRRDGVGQVVKGLDENPVVVAEGVIGAGKTSFLKELDRHLQANNQKSYSFDCNRYLANTSYLGPGTVSALLDFEEYLDELSINPVSEQIPVLLLDNGDSLYGSQITRPLDNKLISMPAFISKLKQLVDEKKMKLIITAHKPQSSGEYPKDEHLYELFKKTFSDAQVYELQK